MEYKGPRFNRIGDVILPAAQREMGLYSAKGDAAHLEIAQSMLDSAEAHGTDTSRERGMLRLLYYSHRVA